MVGVGIVGIGFMGMIHYLAYGRSKAARVAALCSRDPKKLAGDWTGIQGNFGPRGTQMDLSGHARYEDFGALLADPNVGLVDICVPNDGHASMAIRALEAGKDVIVEKPIALSIDDADAMLAAAKKSGRKLMVAHVLPYFPEFAYALDAVRSGRHGKLLAAHLTRVISNPDWSTGIADADRSGGPAIDLHIHDTHFVTLLAGVPRAVRSVGVSEGDAVVHLSTQYLYDEPNLAISAVSGAVARKGRPFAHAFEMYLERATLSFGFAATVDAPHVDPLAVILPDGTVERPSPGSGDPIDAFAEELSEAAEASATGRDAPRLSAEAARQALALCRAEIAAVRGGETVRLA